MKTLLGWLKIVGIVLGSVGALATMTWGIFSWVDARQDNEADINKVIYQQVIPKLDYLIKADSSSKAKDVQILNKIDSVGERVEANTAMSSAVISSYTNWVKKHALTTEEFIEYMGPFMMDLKDLKKNDNSNLFDQSFQRWEYQPVIPEDWILIPDMSLRPVKPFQDTAGK